MSALRHRSAGRSRRSKIGLALAGALLVIVVAAGILLATGSPLLAGLLPGATAAACPAGFDCPPGWDARANNIYTLQPIHTAAGGQRKYLAEERFWTCNYINYVSIWPWDEQRHENRQWIFAAVWDAPGYFRIANNDLWVIGESDTGYVKCYRFLAVKDAATNAGADVIVWKEEGGANHQWRLHEVKSGLYMIESRSAPGLCLGIRNQGVNDGSRLELQPCGQENAMSQVFVLTRQIGL